MTQIYEIAITIYLGLVLILTFLISIPILAVCYPFVDEKTFARINEVIGGTLLLKAMTIPGFWSFKITDLRKNKDFDGRYIIISNHASFIDFILICQFPNYKKFIMAEKFTKIPIFGTICKGCGHVFVDRFKRNTTQVALDKCIDSMKDGCSFVMFPEGRRSENPYKLLPFKTGAFRLSQRTGVPILPVVIKGSGEAMPVGDICHLANIELVVGEPIQIESDWEDIKTHPAIEQVRSFILEQLDDKINKDTVEKTKDK